MKAIQVLSSVFPAFFAKKIYTKFLHPQIQKLKPHEIKVLNKAEKQKLEINGNLIQLYKWGNGSEKILFVHGWEGHAGNYADLVEKFLPQNFTIYAFDGPGHGQSTGGQNIMFEYTETVHKVISMFNITKLVSHSFGSVASSYSLTQIPNHKIERFVMLTTPRKFTAYVENMAQKMNVSQKAVQLFFNKIENESQINVNNLDVSIFVQSINVEKALIIHDKNDRIIPISEAKYVNKSWPASEFLEIENTGHFRILRTESVAQKVLDFMKN